MKLPIKFAVITALVLFSLTTRLGAKPANGKISLLPGADSSLEAAVESLQPDGGLLELGAGIYRLEETSIPENVDLHFLPGAVIEVAKNLKINGGLQAGETQIFSGPGTVSGMVKTAVVLPQWFGAKADGMHDDTRAIQQAADLAQFSSGKLLRLNPGSYVFSDSINIRCNVDCRGTLLQRLEVDHEKTKHSNFTYVPSHFVRKVFRVSIVPDQPALRLKSEPFLGLKAGDFKLPLAGKVELEDGSGTVELQEGGSIRFFSTDFFSSRHNQYGDEWYDKTEISMLVSGRGDFYPELMYSYLPPPEAAEWNEQQQYKKGDYCSHEGKLYKAVWASGPGATFKHNFKGLVQLGPSKPRPGTTSYPMTFDDGIEDNIRTWREVYTQVYYQPPQAALSIDGLSIEVSVVGSDTEKLRLNSGSALSVKAAATPP